MKAGWRTYIPAGLKKMAWRLFLSPQRQEGVSYTWMVEIRGTASLMKKRMGALFSSAPEPVSICFALNQETEKTWRSLLPALPHLKNAELVELSVVMDGVAHATEMEAYLKKCWAGKLVIAATDTIAPPLHQAIIQASNPIVVACGAPIFLPENLVQICPHYISAYTNWFIPGKKFFAGTRDQYLQAGGLNPRKKGLENQMPALWMQMYIAGFYPLNKGSWRMPLAQH